MTLYLDGHAFRYELENVARMFFDSVNVAIGQPIDDGRDFVHAVREGNMLLCAFRVNGRTAESSCEVSAGENALVEQDPSDGLQQASGGKNARKTTDNEAITGVGNLRDGIEPAHSPKSAQKSKGAEKQYELELAKLMYDGLCELTGKHPAWGIITGIRPAKFAQILMRGGLSPQKTIAHLENEYRVSKSKAELCVATARHSEAAARLNGDKSYSLYVSIPFCPSRCSYCSFVSKTLGKDRLLLNEYLDRLCLELETSAAIADELGLHLESAYIGGGTPTVLSAPQLERLTGEMNRLFNARGCREFSVEAGRPDTINRDKLAALKAAGVSRLSINPQTSNNSVLSLAGRAHTKEDIERCFSDARLEGHENINADLIAGLPGDDIGGFTDSVRWVESLAPENITVHALTLKRASTLTKDGGHAAKGASDMVDFAYSYLTNSGYEPYYMYKQKGTVDSLENTGYSKKGFDCLYNIYIMDELHTIIACGAGAVTKLKDPESPRIERIYNYKYPAEYIRGFAEMLNRKAGIKTFYEGIF